MIRKQAFKPSSGLIYWQWQIKLMIAREHNSIICMFCSLGLVTSPLTSTHFHSVAQLLWPIQTTVILYITFPHPPLTETKFFKCAFGFIDRKYVNWPGNLVDLTRYTWDSVVIFPANRSLPELLRQQWSMFLLSLIEWVEIWPWVESEEQPCIQRSGAVIRWTHIHISYSWRDRQERLWDILCCRMFCYLWIQREKLRWKCAC